MKIGYLGTGAWGFALASLLSAQGHEVISWSIESDLVEILNKTKTHPRLPGHPAKGNIRFTLHLEEALEGVDLLVESVTSAGFRPVFENVRLVKIPSCPIVITSKGIEQDTGLILSDVIFDVLGEELISQVGAISGPSFASEVVKGLPTSVVGSGYYPETMKVVCDTFTTDNFRVYPNSDMRGIAYGGALKNVIAIASGAAEGLELGYSARAALMTRGLHEMTKMAVAKGCRTETLYGLSGMGDLCLTCSSITSRNFKFGYLLAKGMSPEEAQEEVGMVVEGAYTAVSAYELSQQLQVTMPITEMVYQIINNKMHLRDAVKTLMQREVKEEHL